MKSMITLICCLFLMIRSNCETEESNSIKLFGTEVNTEAVNSTTEDVLNETQESISVINDMNCAKSEIEKHNEVLLASELLKNGAENLKNQNGIDEETILVLGNAGSGKTTFSQFMAGDSTKLMSMEVGNDTGEFLIVDGSKIGVSPIDSQTLFPEQVKINSDVSFTDTPGFSDTRSPRYELTVSYVMKKYLENIKRVKIVLLITYNSVQYGVYKDDFMNLLRSTNNFIKNINEHKGSIILLANKVPNIYKVSKSEAKLVPDQNIIRSIANFIHEVKESAIQKAVTENNTEEKKFLENAVKLIESFEETDENGNHKRINIFRRPSEAGSLATAMLLQNEKQSIKKMIDKMKYIELTGSSITYYLSDKAKLYLNCLLQYVNEKIDTIIAHVFQLTGNHYQQKIKNYTDIYDLNTQLHSGLARLKSLKNELEGSVNLTNFLSLTQKFITDENIHSVKIDKHSFTDIYEHMNNFQRFLTNNYNPFSPEIWSEQLKPLITNVKENVVWYDSLIEIFKKLSSYDSQKTKSDSYNTTNLNTDINPFKLIYSDSNQNLNINYFNGKILSDERRKEFDEILTMTFKATNNITCDAEGKFKIVGYFIKISSLVNGILEKYCGDVPVKVIIINAYTVFIDQDINRLDLNGIKIMIAAINWEVIGRRKIVIDGKPPRYHEASKAPDGENLGEDGVDGMDGFLGNNGGEFLGIGLKFKNILSLLVSANGGEGGPGQHGGNGAKGKTGKHGYEKFTNEPSLSSITESWDQGYRDFPTTNQAQSKSLTSFKDHNCAGTINLYHKDGECGEAGGKGGNGGMGGYGGYAGKIMFVSAINESIQIPTKTSEGISGKPGKGGKGGIPGNKGFSSTCYQLNYTDLYTRPTTSFYWVCSNGTDYQPTICAESNYNSPDGESNSNTTRIDTLTEIEDYNFLYDYVDFESEMKRHWNNKFLNGDIMKFRVQNVDYINSIRNTVQSF